MTDEETVIAGNKYVFDEDGDLWISDDEEEDAVLIAFEDFQQVVELIKAHIKEESE